MKKQIVLMAIAAMFSITAVNAQGGGGQRQTPEERTKAAIENMAPLNMDAETKAKAEVIIAEFNNDSQKAMAALRESGADREAMMEKRKELAAIRDGKLKLIFTETQMKQWKGEIEPSLNPPRGGGQRGGGK